MTVTALPARAEAPQEEEAKAFGIGGVWTARGPSPIVFDLENVDPDGSVDGAVHALAPHPQVPSILYVGAVNGGVWVTFNATAERPNWQRLTDNQVSQSIGALEFDPTDPTHRTLVAGPGTYSSFADGGDLAGLLRTTNGGATWKRLTGRGVMINKSISGLAARGSVIVVSADAVAPGDFSNTGIFRSSDFGTTFTQVSRRRGAGTGLPLGISHDLAGDPLRPSRLYTSVLLAEVTGGKNGIYRSTDTGKTWTKVSTPAVDAFLKGDAITSNVEFAVGRHNNVFVAIVNDHQLAAVFRSGDGGTTWKRMDLPVTIENGVPIGIHPGGQGEVHLSIAADPTNPNIVYIGGDRQPAFNETEINPPRRIFPNSIGSTGFWGRLFRGDAGKPAGSQWVHLTHKNTLGPAGGGTGKSSAPHVDSREMQFDAAGNLLESDDGGVYKRTLPRSNTGDWVSLNGDLQVTEVHDIEIDRNSDILFGGAQDTNLIAQNLPGSMDWGFILYGDGGDVNVDDTSTPGESVRFTNVSFLRNFNRSFWDTEGGFLGIDLIRPIILDGGDPLVAQFYTPIRVSGGNPKRLVIGGENSVYESLDQGDTATEIGPGIRTNGFGLEGMAYGVPANPDVLYIGGSNNPDVFPGHKLWVRTGPPPAPLVRSVSYPGTLPVAAITIDPRNGSHAFVVTANAVYRTPDAGVTWSKVTGNLQSFNPSVLRSAAFVHTSFGDAVVVGSNRGAYIATARSGFSSWSLLGSSLPTVPLMDLRYNPQDDEINAASLGRGVWTLSHASFAVLLAD